MQHLDGKVAVVTGAASGIGLAMVERFLAEGMRVAMADVEAGALARAASELGAAPDRLLPVVTDVADAASVDALAERTIDVFGAAHLLCNNAGVSTFGRSWKFSLADWEWVLGVNLWGVIHGVRAFVPRFVEQGEGHVVNTSSMVGVTSCSGLAPYSVSKHGVVALSEALDLELRDVGANVGVSVLCPGFVRTRIGESERNRPLADGEARSGIQGSVAALLDVGIDPAQVADQVLRAVQDGQFWVFTHPEMLAAAEHRTTTMLEGSPPVMIDLQSLLPASGDR